MRQAGHDTGEVKVARLRLLLVEDSTDDAQLVCRELEGGGFALDWHRVDTEEKFIAALDDAWDVIVCDHMMPRFDGARALAISKERGLDTPFIFISSAPGEERAIEAMRNGARDYLLKTSLTRLPGVVRRELVTTRNRRVRREAQAATLREQRRLAAAVEASGAGVFEFRVPADSSTYWSDRCAAILGYSPDELPTDDSLVTWSFEQVHPEDLSRIRESFAQFVDGHSETFAADTRMLHREGHWVDVASFAKAVSRDADGRATHVVGVVSDRTEQKTLEAQLRQAQKMDAVGRLAGGVAHDFNNLLTAIFSFGNFVLEELRPEDPVHKDMQEVLKAAAAAQRLTAQLLAFSRRKTIEPRVINLNGLVEDMDRMLRRIVGEDIDVSTTLADGLWNVRADPGSLEQVIVNVVINARDAMPEGGRLTIETMNASLDGTYGRAHGAKVPTGDYVAIAISDDGVGMDHETQRRIFEPFFTTRDAGTGTGLGLSTCYGIIKQAGGFIWVYSELGRGTTFKIYIPRVIDTAVEPTRAQPRRDYRGRETVLVAEDDDQVRRLTVRALTRLGYQVIDAASGGEALLRCEQTKGVIHLLLTDVIMPEMSGEQLAARLAQIRPAMRVLYMSGYTANAIVHRGVLDPGTHLLQKPFTPDALAAKVREVLDG